jgi:hypothetical protein
LNNDRAAFAISGEGQARLDVGPFQLRKIFDDFVGGHAVRKPSKDIINGNAKAADDGTPTALTRR